MTWRIFGLFLSVVSVVIYPTLEAAADGAGWKIELQSFLDRAAGALEVPGAAVVVVTREGGTTILTHGVACAGGRDPVTPQTSFGIGSLTKAFTSTAAAVLVGDGLIDWDTTARTLVPELELTDPTATEWVTLRDLLAHRSGLGDDTLLALNIEGSPEWIVSRLSLVEPAGDFRDRFIYSSLGYTLAGVMIGRASGSSWNGVVAETLLEPMGMTSTMIGAPQEEGVDSACGHLHWRGSVTTLAPLDLSVGAPGNGLYSTAEDMARWLELLLGGGTVNGRRIVDPSVLSEALTPQVAIRGSGPELRAYGLGWYLSSWRGRRHLFHGGGGVGFTSQVRVFPDAGVAVLVLANRAASGLPDAVAERASRLVFEEPVDEELLDKVVRMTSRIEALHAAQGESLLATADPEAPPSLDMSAFAGCYENPALGRLVVRAEGDAIAASFHDIDLAVEHLHDDLFMLSSVYMGDFPAAFAVGEDTARSVTLSLESPEVGLVFERGAGSCAPGPPDPPPDSSTTTAAR